MHSFDEKWAVSKLALVLEGVSIEVVLSQHSDIKVRWMALCLLYFDGFHGKKRLLHVTCNRKMIFNDLSQTFV